MAILPEVGDLLRRQQWRGRCHDGSLRGSQAPSSNEFLCDLCPYLVKAHQRRRTAHPPICPACPVLPFAVCCVWADCPLRVGAVLPAQYSPLKACPRG